MLPVTSSENTGILISYRKEPGQSPKSFQTINNFTIFKKGLCILFQLHAISERLKMACPPMEKTDQMYDFSHVLDFCSQVRSLNIEGSYEKLGTSNIVPNNLHFDLIPFKSLVDLKILGVPMACIQSVGEW